MPKYLIVYRKFIGNKKAFVEATNAKEAINKLCEKEDVQQVISVDKII